MSDQRFFDLEHRYIVRQHNERWRMEGLPPTGVCRCEPRTVCFDHAVYLNDCRTEAVKILDSKGDDARASKMFIAATEFFLKLTE